MLQLKLTMNISEYKLKVKAILKSVGNYVYNNLKSNKVLINPPQGAFYLMPEFKNKSIKLHHLYVLQF